MRCPYCGEKDNSVVTDSRYVESKDAIRRRRKCLFCNSRFTTYEMVFSEVSKRKSTKFLIIEGANTDEPKLRTLQ